MKKRVHAIARKKGIEKTDTCWCLFWDWMDTGKVSHLLLDHLFKIGIGHERKVGSREFPVSGRVASCFSAASMVQLLRLQPFKGLYLTLQFFSTILLRLPVWFLFAIPQSFRPSSLWAIGKVVKMKLTLHLLSVTRKTGPIRVAPNHLSITPGVDVNGVWIPATPGIIKDELEIWANVAKVTSISIPGYWVHRKGSIIPVAAPPIPGERIIYALHGGGYVTLSAHPSDPTAAIARGLVRYVDSVHRVFSPEYRLSSGSGIEAKNAFPTALIDALAGYIYLVKTVGFHPSDIIVEGDSAGGNLALALTRYLVEHPNAGLPAPPGSLVLLSPWTDLGPQDADPHSSWVRNVKTDYIGLVDLEAYLRAVGSFVGPHGLGAAETNLMISPASRNPAMMISFKGFPPTFIAAGGGEVFLDMISVLKDRMVKDLGHEKVKYYCPPAATHDWVALPFFEPERTNTLKEIASWLAASS
ncbi:hypothetical protein D9757_000659 [Collybiopsis confluens]|uniref:Alpha/beta hydrolase fold-3 domain-containing protein n=1 Tax=Collybiopsis confluens TaxID=2823264 RepID=A0A8H5MH67_9AGAR|nr:hypothetical protein D9757_000659 [Collybiopsis confluens]